LQKLHMTTGGHDFHRCLRNLSIQFLKGLLDRARATVPYSW